MASSAGSGISPALDTRSAKGRDPDAASAVRTRKVIHRAAATAPEQSQSLARELAYIRLRYPTLAPPPISSCVVVCWSGSGCTDDDLQELEYSVTSSGNWATRAWTSDSVPFGTFSIGIDCTAGASGYYDKLFFTQPPTAAHF